MVYDKRRQNITPAKGDACVFLQDYHRRRMNPETFRLCSACPQNHPGARYKLCCSLHNK
jgi:hypothetical protein